jgi:hypothetical protein
VILKFYLNCFVYEKKSSNIAAIQRTLFFMCSLNDVYFFKSNNFKDLLNIAVVHRIHIFFIIDLIRWLSIVNDYTKPSINVMGDMWYYIIQYINVFSIIVLSIIRDYTIPNLNAVNSLKSLLCVYSKHCGNIKV